MCWTWHENHILISIKHFLVASAHSSQIIQLKIDDFGLVYFHVVDFSFSCVSRIHNISQQPSSFPNYFFSLVIDSAFLLSNCNKTLFFTIWNLIQQAEEWETICIFGAENKKKRLLNIDFWVVFFLNWEKM